MTGFPGIMEPERRIFLAAEGISPTRVSNLIAQATNIAHHYGIPMPNYLIDGEAEANGRLFFESQAAYLRRHELLTQDEVKRLEPMDYARRAIVNLSTMTAIDPLISPGIMPN
jgi:hypothetical protein